MKMKRFISIAFSVALLVALLCSPAHAATTDIFTSPEMTAGEEWSGLAHGQVKEMVCNNLEEVSGSDIGIDFHTTWTGLPTEFERDATRTAKITVREDDAGSNPNETLFYCIGTFKTVNNVYCLRNFGTRSNINTTVIEDNNIVELYLLIEIDTKLADTSTEVPAGLFRYNFKTTY